MAQTESNTHSFIVKIWLENVSETQAKVKWRGRIQHVPDHASLHFEDLRAIGAFIAPYLERMGTDPCVGWRRWLKPWKRWLARKA